MLKTEKIGFAGQGRFSSNAIDLAGGRLLAVLLDPGGAQPSEAVLVDGKLPGQEFINSQRITAAGFLEGEQTAANRGNDLGLATDDPPLGAGCGQIRNR